MSKLNIPDEPEELDEDVLKDLQDLEGRNRRRPLRDMLKDPTILDCMWGCGQTFRNISTANEHNARPHYICSHCKKFYPSLEKHNLYVASLGNGTKCARIRRRKRIEGKL